jgi:hypothetical protein
MVVWCAGEIDGGSADTMEKERLKEGWRRLGVYFRHPSLGSIFFEEVSAKRDSRLVSK